MFFPPGAGRHSHELFKLPFEIGFVLDADHLTDDGDRYIRVFQQQLPGLPDAQCLAPSQHGLPCPDPDIDPELVRGDLDSIMVDIYGVKKLRRIASIAESIGAEYFPTYPLKKQTSPTDRKKSLVDIGPVFNTINYNRQEGLRLRLGFMTTATLHNKNFFNGYVAYGFHDQKFKGELNYIHTFEKKDFHPFEPLRHYITFTAGYDLEGPGQSYTLLDRDNILMTTFKEQPLQYVRRFQIKYDREWLSRLSFTTTLRFDRITPTGTLSYSRFDANGALEPVPVFNDYSWTFRLRYAI